MKRTPLLDSTCTYDPTDSRFDFVLLIPSNLCSHDRHPNGKIMHNLYAELEGIDESSTRLPSRKSTQNSITKSPYPPTSSHSPSSDNTPSGTISPPSGSTIQTPSYFTETPRGTDTPLYDPRGAIDSASLTFALQSMELSQQGDNEPGPSRGRGSLNVPAPPYQLNRYRDEASSEGRSGEVPWYRGVVKKERYIELLYNCHPEGGVTELDVVVRDAVPGLGPFELTLESDCVSSLENPCRFKTDHSGRLEVCSLETSNSSVQVPIRPFSHFESVLSQLTRSVHHATIQRRQNRQSPDQSSQFLLLVRDHMGIKIPDQGCKLYGEVRKLWARMKVKD